MEKTKKKRQVEVSVVVDTDERTRILNNITEASFILYPDGSPDPTKLEFSRQRGTLRTVRVSVPGADKKARTETQE